MIRIGILGATRGLNFAFAAKKYALELKIAAVCDSFQPLLDKVKDQLPPLGFNPVFYSDYGEMLEKADIDAVVIANNANEHAPAAVAALNSGRHVLSECLPTQTPDEAVKLIEAVRRSGKRYSYAENYCYYRANFEAALRFRRGDIGTLVEAEGDFINDCSGRWHLLTRGRRDHWRNLVPSTFYCTHSIGPMLYAVRQRPVRVSGFEVQCQDYMREHGARNGSAAQEMIELESGAYIKSLHGNLKRPWVTRMRLYGTRGSLEVQDMYRLTMHLENAARNGFDSTEIQHFTPVPGIPENIMDNAEALEIWCFLGAVEGNPVALEYGVDVYSALEMSLPGLYAYRSILDGNKPMEIPNIRSASGLEQMCGDKRCTDPKTAQGKNLLPSYAHGEIMQPDSVYKHEAELLQEEMEKNFHLGMN